MNKIVLAFAVTGLIAAAAAPTLAGPSGTTVSLACDLASKEFAGPVVVKNTSNAILKKGMKVSVVAFTAYGKEQETIVLAADVPVGYPVKGSKIYQNVSGGCQASVFYPKAQIKLPTRS